MRPNVADEIASVVDESDASVELDAVASTFMALDLVSREPRDNGPSSIQVGRRT